MKGLAFQALPVKPSLLGESPLWHPVEQRLYWCDIPAKLLNCYDPITAVHQRWPLDSEPGCCAAVQGGGLLLALRRGLVFFEPSTGDLRTLVAAPYDSRLERFNDGKTDADGRFWLGTIYEPRDATNAALYCFDGEQLIKRGDGITTSNGLAWSPGGDVMYWADTKAHSVRAFDFDMVTGSMTRPRTFCEFPGKTADQDLASYKGRPDGAAVDAQGCYWVAMFEGARLMRFAPTGEPLAEIELPVRCPTMPCFGGADLKTLYLTTSRENRPALELEREPLAGYVLHTRVEVPGLPSALARAPKLGELR